MGEAIGDEKIEGAIVFRVSFPASRSPEEGTVPSRFLSNFTAMTGMGRRRRLLATSARIFTESRHRSVEDSYEGARCRFHF